ncbi:hypothetical protein TNCV_4834971 [Trichonephila clavipes]|nr:hypothetical protein TNCV_4834971 [Trichonephila clavipes]
MNVSGKGQMLAGTTVEHGVLTERLYTKDGAPLPWGTGVRSFSNQHLPKRWIGRSGNANDVFCSWSPDHRT